MDDLALSALFSKGVLNYYSEAIKYFSCKPDISITYFRKLIECLCNDLEDLNDLKCGARTLEA